jgi:WD40 repeat protein
MQEVHALHGHVAAISCVTFSPDGQWLASADLDRIVRIWDVRTGNEYLAPGGHIHLEGFTNVEKRMPWDRGRPLVPRLAFSADSRRLASINGRQPVQIWDIATGLPALSLPVQESSIMCLGFSSNGRWLAASAGIWLHVWDAGSSEMVPAAHHH